MLTLHCPPDQVYALTSFLRENGAEAVAVADLDYVFSRDNPLFSKLEAGPLKRGEIDRLVPVERATRSGGNGYFSPLAQLNSTT